MKKLLKTTPVGAVGISIFLMIGIPPGVLQGADYPPPGDFQRGAATWAENCGRCHNIRAAQDLRDDQWITSVFHMRVRAGLTGQEARDVLTFLQASNDKGLGVTRVSMDTDESGSTGQSGHAIYLQTCVACHGANGTGVIPGAPDLTRKDGPLTKPDAVLIRNITAGFQSPGSIMAMPPKGGNPALTGADIRSVLAYIRAQFGR